VTQMRRFHIGIVLSITHDALMSPTRPPISGIYEILNYMTGDNLYTHQLPRAALECRPFILGQHPQLAEWTGGVTPENVHQRIYEAVKQFGQTLEIAPLPRDAHERIDPLSELAEMVHPEKIVVVRS
jgi:hypothetical protein